MHQLADIVMGVTVIALGFALIRAAQVNTKLEKLSTRQSREIDCLLDANGAMFLAFVEDAAQMHQLRNENSAMWDFIHNGPLSKPETWTVSDEEPIPFLPSDELVKIWDKDQPYLFDDVAFRDAVDELQPIELIQEKLGGVVIEHDFHSTPDCGE